MHNYNQVVPPHWMISFFALFRAVSPLISRHIVVLIVQQEAGHVRQAGTQWFSVQPLLTHTPLSQQCGTSRGGAVMAGRKHSVGLEGSWEQDRGSQ